MENNKNKRQSDEQSTKGRSIQTEGIPTAARQEPQTTSEGNTSAGRQQQPKEWQEDSQAPGTERAPQTQAGAEADRPGRMQERDEKEARK